MLTALQEEGLALRIDVSIPRAANPVLTSLPILGSLCFRIAHLHSCSPCFIQSSQSSPSDGFFPSNKKSGYCETFIDI